MLILPTDLLDGNDGPVLNTAAACVVAYRANVNSASFAVLVTQPTLVHVRRGTKLLPPLNGDEPLIVREGHTVLLPTGMQYMSELLPVDGAYESTVISFEPSFLARILPECSTVEPWRGGCLIDPLPGLDTVLDGLPSYIEDGLGARLLELKLEEIAIKLARQDQSSKQLLLDGVRVGFGDSRLRETMQRYFHQPLRLSEFATLSGLGLSTFKREFKHLFGTSPGRWLIDARLTYAAQLLGSRQVTVTEVCLVCGFGDLSHFIRAFGQKFGVSPKQWQLQTLHASAQVKDTS